MEGVSDQVGVESDEEDNDEVQAPFPKIRGARLERLFFSSEHNPERCTMCRRRGVRPGGAPAHDGGRPSSPSWLPSRMGRHHGHREEEDEGRRVRVKAEEGEAGVWGGMNGAFFLNDLIN